MDSLIIRMATAQDIEKVAKLHVLEKNLLWSSAVSVFETEFSICAQYPDLRSYFLCFHESDLISYAGARYYDQLLDENMYGTNDLLPSGWYLRGIRVHPDWRRNGIARKMTIKRLEWLSKRSKQIYVFLDDENKISLPMYYELGFKEQSRGWTFSDTKRKTQGILLKLEI